MALDPITAVLDIGGKLIDRLWPDPTQRDVARLELLKMQQSGELAKLAADTEIAKAQTAVNEAEAGSGSAYSSSWRPTVGYACVAGLIYSFLVQPLFPWFAALAGKPVPPLPELDTSVLMTLLLGMLGIGGMRSFDKKSGTTS